MKIIVCIKQVPAKDAPLAIAGNWIKESDIGFEMNEPDSYALEEALRLKEKHGGEVIALSLGPERVKQTIGLRRIERDKQYPGLTFLVVAAVEKGTIGYLNAPDAALLPPLGRDGFIMIKPVTDGWWLYKRLE